MLRGYLVVFLMSCICLVGFSQDGVPVYSDYFADNLYLLHPSMAGAANSDKLRITARQQWMDQDFAPNLQTLSGSVRAGERSGIGIILFNDRNGFHSQQGAYLSYAHHIMFSRTVLDLNQLSFGLTAGMVQSKLDETFFDLSDFDPVIVGIVQSSTYVNIDVGVSYNFLDFSTHFTIKNVLFQNRTAYSDRFEPTNQRRYLFSGAYTFSGRFNSGWYYEPSFLFQFFESTEESAIDVNFKAYREVDFGTIWGGVSYRRSLDGAVYGVNSMNTSVQKLQYLSPIVGLNYNQFVFAYTYTYQLGQEKFHMGSFHQITLGYNLFESRGPYDCRCPAVN